MTYPPISRYLLGVVALLIALASIAFAAVAIRRRYLGGWDGALARLAEAVIGLALLTLTLEALGAVGLFSLMPIVLASMLIGVAAAKAFGRAGRNAATVATAATPGSPIGPTGPTTATGATTAIAPASPTSAATPTPPTCAASAASPTSAASAASPTSAASAASPTSAASAGTPTVPTSAATPTPPTAPASRTTPATPATPSLNHLTRGATAPPSHAAPVFGVIAVAATTAVVAEWAAITLRSYDVGIRTFDSVWYHLPWAAWFAQTGHVTPLRFTDVEYLTAFYPATAELFHGLGIVLFARDTPSPAMNLVWLGLVLLAGYCVGRPRGLGPLTLTATALAMAVPAIDVSQAGSAANDVVGVFFVLAAVALVLNGAGSRAPLVMSGAGSGAVPVPDGSGSRPALVLAAASAGLAVSVKLSMLAPVAALTVGVLVISPRGRRRAAAALWLVPLLITGGFWYLRNLIAVGNPLPWLDLPGLAIPAPALQQHTGFAVAHYLTSAHAWKRFFEPGLAAGLGPWWYLIVAIAIAGPVLCLLRGAGAPLRMVALVALASFLAYLMTPETAAGPNGDPLGFAFNLRYAAPVLALSLPLLPLAPALDGDRRRLALAVALIAVLSATLAQARLWPARQAGGVIGVALVVLVVGAVGLLRAQRPRQRPRHAEQCPPRRPRRRPSPAPAVAAAGAALLVAAIVAGYPWQRHYLHGRYAFHRGVSSLAGVWSFFRGVHRARVGVVGTFGGFFSYPLFGIDNSNHVEYIGRRGPYGSFTSIRSCAAWRAAVNGGHFRYLVTTPARDPWHPRPLHASPERAWTVTDPAARLIYTRYAFGQPISIFELHGALQMC